MNMNSAMNQTMNYLAGTREFMELNNACSILKKNPKASTLVEQFQKKEESIYSSYPANISQSQLSYLIDELNKDHEKLMTIPEIRSYFNASESFNRVLDDFIKELNQAIFQKLA